MVQVSCVSFFIATALFLQGCTPTVTPAQNARRSSAIETKTQAPSPVTAFINVTVIPMDTERVLSGQTVLVEQGRITKLGPVAQVSIPRGALRIDGQGKYLIPGLADMHFHLEGDSLSVERALFMLAANGVTTIRMVNAAAMDSGAVSRANGARFGRGPFEDFLLRVKARAASGTLTSPRMFMSGPWAPRQYLGTAKFLKPPVTDPPPRLDSVGAYVAAYKAAGYDFVKVHEEETVVAESLAVAARRVGLPILGHLPLDGMLKSPARTIKWAAQAGYESIEHTAFYDLLSFLAPREIPEIGRTLVAEGVWTCPTLINGVRSTPQASGPVYGAQYIPSRRIQEWKTLFPQASGGTLIQQRRGNKTLHPIIKSLHQGGPGILSGSDAGDVMSVPYVVPGFSLHEELATLTEFGLTPYEALVTSTRNVAVYFGTLATTGTIAQGKRADLVLLDGNPLQDIQNTRQIAGVMLGGKWLPRTDLERRLAMDRPAWVAQHFYIVSPVTKDL